MVVELLQCKNCSIYCSPLGIRRHLQKCRTRRDPIITPPPPSPPPPSSPIVQANILPDPNAESSIAAETGDSRETASLASSGGNRSGGWLIETDMHTLHSDLLSWHEEDGADSLTAEERVSPVLEALDRAGDFDNTRPDERGNGTDEGMSEADGFVIIGAGGGEYGCGVAVLEKKMVPEADWIEESIARWSSAVPLGTAKEGRNADTNAEHK